MSKIKMADDTDYKRAHEQGFKLAVDREVVRCSRQDKAYPRWVREELARRSREQVNDPRLVQSDGQLKRDMIIAAALDASDGDVRMAMKLLEHFHIEPKQKSKNPEKYHQNYVPVAVPLLVPEPRSRKDGDWLWTEDNMRLWKKRHWGEVQPCPDASDVFEDYLAKT